ncbi:MAG: membrane protein insertase YidC [Gordonia sp. (in: high G+C Gram-positive bacteria)]
MLNFIYYPVSYIMWVWHWLFDAILPSSPGWDGVSWTLSVVFLVFSLRAILYKPFVKQIQTTKKMQEINPQMQAIRKKYAKDRVKMTEEMQKLQKEHGFNPLLGCLPMLLQIPVFIGLFHVLRSFNRYVGSGGSGSLVPHAGPSLDLPTNRATGNYAFSADLVQNFLDARLFGIPLSSFVTQPMEQWKAFVPSGNLADIDFTRWQIGAVVVPLMILSSLATHMNSRASVGRQSVEAMENPQTRIMNKLALYVFPLGILVTGVFFPVAILIYWVANNGWTYVQQHLVFGRMEREEEEQKAAKQEKLKAAAPKPGARPGKAKRDDVVELVDGETIVTDDEATAVDLDKPASKPKPGAKPAGDAAKKPSPAAQQKKSGGGKAQSGSKSNKKRKQGRPRG